MKLLSTIHRWAGGFLGLLLALLGLSGTILLWEGEWVSLPHAGDPPVEQVETIGRIAEREVLAGALRITFASEEIGLHHVAAKGGAGSYVAQDGTTVARWESQWERPELWLFDLHHHLFSGATGELVTGWAGVAGLLFLVTGVILWWRSRRAFRWRLWPDRFQPGPVVAHHRDLGILVAPLLCLTLVTGTGMIFSGAARWVLSPLGTIEVTAPPVIGNVAGRAPVASMLAEAKKRFPEGQLRRLTSPSQAGQPWSIRMRQPFEWTPNGRTTLYFDGQGRLLRVDDPAGASRAASINEAFYPVHSAKVGGLPWKLVMSISGLSLTLLGGLATWSFWIRKARRRRKPVTASAALGTAALSRN